MHTQIARSALTATFPLDTRVIGTNLVSRPTRPGTAPAPKAAEVEQVTMATDFAPELDAADDERLITLAQQGDLDAFNQLVTRHERSVFSVCLRILRDTAAAEDATQDTFLKAWTASHTFRGGMVRPWLLRIATNRCYDTIRAQNRRQADSLDAELYEVEPAWSSHVEPSEDPEAFAARVELSGYLEQALADLPVDQRTVVMLSDVHGYAYEEIASILDIAVGTVKSRISRGRARLRQLLTENPDTRDHFTAFARQQ